MFDERPYSPIQKLDDDLFNTQGVELFVKREDLIHPHISGNKWRKLKYNILEAKDSGIDTILTFGGAYSNHIAATAAAGKEFGIKTIGIIRGEELNADNPTLQFAREQGMKLDFVSRETYRSKYNEEFQTKLKSQFGEILIVPEGGANDLGVKGCSEILDNSTKNFDVIALACGTGSTVAGIYLSGSNQEVWGFSVLKGEFQNNEIKNMLSSFNKEIDDSLKILTDYHFGGYAKFTTELIDFIKNFKTKHKIQLDPIYTGKLFFGINDQIKKGVLEGKKILAIHSGGLQGIKGFEQRFSIDLSA